MENSKMIPLMQYGKNTVEHYSPNVLRCTKCMGDHCTSTKGVLVYIGGAEYCFCVPEKSLFVCTARQILSTNCICPINGGQVYEHNGIRYCICYQTEALALYKRKLDRSVLSTSRTSSLNLHAGDYQVHHGRLYYYDPKGNYIEIGNAYLEIVGEYAHIESNCSSKTEIEVNVFIDGALQQTVSVGVAEYKNFLQRMKTTYANLVIPPYVRNLESIYEHYLGVLYQSAYMNATLKRMAIYHSYGWQQVGDTWLYMEDGKQCEYFSCKTDFRIPYDGTTLPQTAYHQALGFLNVARQLPNTLIPFLFLQMGICATFFEQAGFPIRFVLYMYGPSGSMKTSMTSALFYPLSPEPTSMKSTFKDTVAAIEARMGKCSDWVFRIDDYHPQENSQEQMRLKHTLETALRFFGDGIAKNRSNIALEDVAGKRPRCVCCMTGEKIDGTLSSYLRCVLLPVDRNSFDGLCLREFQEKPLLLSNHLHHFIVYLEKNWREVIQYIANKAPEYRKLYHEALMEPRLVDAAMQLHLMAEIFLLYGESIGTQLPENHKKILAEWGVCILDTIHGSCDRSLQMRPLMMYLVAMESMLDARKIKISANKVEYQNRMEYYDGWVDDTYYYFKPTDVYQKVLQFYRDQGVVFTATIDDVHKEMLQLNLLKTTREGSGRSQYLYRTSLPNRPRMLAVDKVKMAALLSDDCTSKNEETQKCIV